MTRREAPRGPSHGPQRNRPSSRRHRQENATKYIRVRKNNDDNFWFDLDPVKAGRWTGGRFKSVLRVLIQHKFGFFRAFLIMCFLARSPCMASGRQLEVAVFAPSDCWPNPTPDFNPTLDYSLSVANTVSTTFSLQYVMQNSCDISLTVDKMSKASSNRSLVAILGPGNPHVCKIVQQIPRKTVPVISWQCHTGAMIRTAPSISQIANAVDSVLRHFKWGGVLVISIREEPWFSLGQELYIRLTLDGFTVTLKQLDSGAVRNVEYMAGILRTSGTAVKAITLSMSYHDAPYVLHAAETSLQTSEYAFLSLSTPHWAQAGQVVDTWRSVYPGSQESFQQSIQSVLFLGVTYPEVELRDFRDNNQENTTIDLNMHDALLLLSAAINRTIDGGGDPMNGTALMKNMQDEVYHPTDRAVFKMDHNAQLVLDFVILDSKLDAFLRVFSVNSSVTLLHGTDVWSERLGPDECFLLQQCGSFSLSYVALIAVVALVLVGAAILTAYSIRKHLLKREMGKGPNKILLTTDDLVFVHTRNFSKSFKNVRSSSPQIEKPDLLKSSTDPSKSFSNFSEDMIDATDSARYNGDIVHLKKLNINNFEMKHKMMHHLKVLRDLRHENLNPFVGCFVDPCNPSIVTEYCSRGSLEDIIHDDNIKLDWSFKLSLLTDLVRGMRYIHTSPLKHHGYLKSGNCVIDSRWVLKITDCGLPVVYERYQTKPSYKPKDMLWTAPEHLRDPPNVPFKGSQRGDVFSFAIIMQEVIVRGTPYCMLDLDPEEIIRKVRKPPPLCRPSVSQQAAPPQYIQIMKQCWTENPEVRPDFESIYQQFKDLNKGKKMNIVDTMFKMLEKYSNDLEELVKDRTDALDEEKKKTEHLISRMLPAMVAKSLLMGKPVEAETYTDVTIYFSDIVGFTTISAMSSPMQVVDLLNDLYTMFDTIIDTYEVYKVETIGDAYMVASGLPVRIKNHAEAICTMALDLLSDCGKFTIKHMPEVPLRLRIGLHSGPCVAGVVGMTMPRYCLFGDTINTASRMESTGAAFRIHISQTTRDKLEDAGGFHIQYRGEVELKGKGNHKTYWLTGKDGFVKPLPEPPDMSGDNHGLTSLIPRNKSFTDAVQTVRNSLRAKTSTIGTGSTTAEDETTEPGSQEGTGRLRKQSSKSCNDLDEIGNHATDFKDEMKQFNEETSAQTTQDCNDEFKQMAESLKTHSAEDPATVVFESELPQEDKKGKSRRSSCGKSQLLSFRKRTLVSEKKKKQYSEPEVTSGPRQTTPDGGSVAKSFPAMNDNQKSKLRRTASSGSYLLKSDKKKSPSRSERCDSRGSTNSGKSVRSVHSVNNATSLSTIGLEESVIGRKQMKNSS